MSLWSDLSPDTFASVRHCRRAGNAGGVGRLGRPGGPLGAQGRPENLPANAIGRESVQVPVVP